MLSEADREFREVAALRPEDGEGPFHLGLIALREARWEEAITQLKIAAERGGPRPAMLHNLALALEALARLDEADRARRSDPAAANGDARLWTGWGLLALRRSDAAPRAGALRAGAHLLWSVPRAGPLVLGLRLGPGAVRGVARCARHGARGRRRLSRSSGAAHDARASCWRGTGKSARPSAPAARTWRRPTIPQISKNLGDLLYRAGRWDEAEEAYQRAAKLAPALGDDLYFKLGNLACRRADMPTARQHWEEAVRLNPEHALARANLSGSKAPQ